MNNPLSITDKARQIVNGTSFRRDNSAIGQFLTPVSIAQFMSSLFEKNIEHVRILDAGAGGGVLLAASVQELCSREIKPKSIEVIAFETDENILPYLNNTVDTCRNACNQYGIDFNATVLNEDFISASLSQLDDGLFAPKERRFTHAILNPPYKKINGQTKTRKLLNSAGMETSNLYSAFVWLAARLLEPAGELVFITPRSFCNGPYFRNFRKALLELMSLRRIHIFESRKKAFADNAVLQENVIFHCVKNEPQSKYVQVSVSEGLDFNNSTIREVPFKHIVFPHDSDAFIHIILNDEDNQALERMSRFKTTLDDLGLDVSTGRVVDFRMREYLRSKPELGTAPLLYPCHFKDGYVKWPISNGKKPNAIVLSNQTQDLMVASGYYVLTKRFSSKEERRRIVSVIFDPQRVKATFIGFENHLNYYHAVGNSMSPDLAKGLSLFLNSTLCDKYFRLFSGHTQVNATDLRKMRYPSRQELVKLGKYVKKTMPKQETIDSILKSECYKNG
ncbi:MAG: Eco57I restriction-modification methylase domain-containing protein [Candidatus Hatepunaea meridiana]|nr:Eco57I restriction-modification methylase domain-containing protein [Candidatus Hatepunaea meridiana]